MLSKILLLSLLLGDFASAGRVEQVVDRLKRFVDAQVAFNGNFHVQIIAPPSLNDSLSSPLQREVYYELLQMNENWPVRYFGRDAFPEEFAYNRGLRNDIHVVLLSPAAFETVLKWGYGENRLLSDVFIFIGEDAPNVAGNAKDAMNVAHLAIFPNSSRNEPMYQLKHLSHDYNVDGLRLWQTKCIAFASILSRSDECFATSGVIKPPTLGPEALKNFRYRYIVVWLRGSPGHNMFLKTVNASRGVGNDTDRRDLVGGIDFRLADTLQNRFGCDLRTVNCYANFSRLPTYETNPYGMLANNMGDQINSGQAPPGEKGNLMAMYVVPNFYDLNAGFDFYTAPPLRFPAWEAMFSTFRWHVWLPFFVAFALITAVLGLTHPTASFTDASSWMLNTMIGRGAIIGLGNRVSAIIMVAWILSAVVLSYSFTGALISALTAPALQMPPQSWQELFDRDYVLKSSISPETELPLTGADGYFSRSDESSVHFKLGARLKKTRIGAGYRDFDGTQWGNNEYFDEYKAYLAKTPGLALIYWSSSNRFLKFNIDSNGDMVLHEGKMNAFPSYFGLVLRRQFLYFEAWSVETRLYFDMGLPHKWANLENEFVRQKVLDQHEYPPKPEKESAKPLTVEHIYGPGIFLSVALIVWSGVLLSEKYHARKKNAKNETKVIRVKQKHDRSVLY